MIMRVLVVMALLLSTGCIDFGARKEARLREAEMEKRIAELEERIASLEAQATRNRELAMPTQTPSTLVPGDGPCHGGPDVFTVARADAENQLADVNGLATQMRIVPSFRDGKSEGFKLFSIRPGTMTASCGFQNGDVLQTVNGYDLSSPEKALEAYAAAKKSSRLEFDIVRRGQPATITIVVE